MGGGALMRAAEAIAPSPWTRRVALLLIAVALVLLLGLLYRAYRLPSTDAATLDAEVVHIAPEVGGRLVELRVQENSTVVRDEVLFRIDPAPFVHAVGAARAELALAEANLATQQRVVASQGATAAIAAVQARKAQTGTGLARRTVERLRPLARDGYVPWQQLDQAELTASDAQRTLEQARRQQTSLQQAVDTTAAAQAAVEARRAALAEAERALRLTTVRAPHAGHVAGLDVTTGEVLAPSQPVFTLITNEQWFANGNFRETELQRIPLGACATVYSMIDRSRPLRGRVVGIGAGVLDSAKVDVPRNVPYVERSLNWVRVAQRFPVRVALQDPPAGLMRLGASAVIEIGHGNACR